MADSLYESLSQNPDTRCIRVFDVEAATSLNFNERIQGNFRIVDLAAPGPYYFSALSYAWGESESQPDLVQCGAHLIPLQTNGLSALKHLRKRLGRFAIWIDALCINQLDQKEKENQIPLMGDIYSKSDTVYIWLGDGNAKTQRAMAYLREPKLMEYFDQARRNQSHKDIERPWSALSVYFAYKTAMIKRRYDWLLSSRRQQRQKQELRNVTAVMLDDLDGFLDAEWIQRMWTYQESLLASKPVVVCGDDHIAWLPFCFSLIYLEYTWVGHQEDPRKLVSLSAWIRLAFSREYVQTISTGSSKPLQVYSWLMGRLIGFDTFFAQYWGDVKISLVQFWGLTSLFWFVGYLCTFTKFRSAKHTQSYPKMLRSMPWGLLMTALVPETFRLFKEYVENWRQALTLTRDSTGATPGTLDLIDPLWKRKAKIDHDKAFALRNILQRVTGADLPSPDYSHPLDKIYESLNLSIIKTRRCRQMLAIASINRLSGHRSWMPDWSKQVDTFWFEDSTRGTFWVSPVEDRVYDEIEAIENNILIVSVFSPLPVERCFKFSTTEDTFRFEQRDIHMKNLELSLALARCRRHIRETSLKGIVISSEIWEHLTELCLLVAPGLSKEQVRRWITFMWDNCKLPTEDVLPSFVANSELIQTQMSICNSLSKSNRQFLWHWRKSAHEKHSNPIREPAKYLASFFSKSWYALGICSSAVEPGDVIVHIDGVSIPLIVRVLGCAEPSQSTRGEYELGAYIVSPARLRGRYPSTPPGRLDTSSTRMTLLLV